MRLFNTVSTPVKKNHLNEPPWAPKGKKVKEYSLEPVATYLAEKLGEDVTLTESALDSGIKTLLTLPATKIILLENLRFHPEEEKNDPDFAKALSNYGDIYVNDAFGSCHRMHASTHRVVEFFGHKNSFMGPLIESEISALNEVLEKPKKPFVSLLEEQRFLIRLKLLIDFFLKWINSLLEEQWLPISRGKRS